MSGSSKKRDDDKTVFDEGEFGIGHNQGPPLDDREVIAAEAEADANADTDSQLLKRKHPSRISGSRLTKEDLAWLRAREKSGQLEKVTWDSPYGSDAIENFEMRMAGPSRPDPSSTSDETGGVDCKWRNPDGLVSKRGYRRIAPDEKRWLNDNNIDELREIAARVLHGRNATVFEKHVTNPLIGLPKSSVRELAAQFGVTEKRIYKILDSCKQRIIRTARGEPPVRNPRKSQWVCVREYIEGKPFLFGPIRQDEEGKYYIEYRLRNEEGI
jgi:hypothetical protein